MPYIKTESDKAISWNEYDCADDFAMEFENTEVVEIKEENDV